MDMKNKIHTYYNLADIEDDVRLVALSLGK